MLGKNATLATKGARRWFRGPVRSAHDAVVVGADRDRLRVPESEGGGVAARAGVVAMESQDVVEEDEAPKVGEPAIDPTAQASLESLLDPSGEAGLSQNAGQLLVQAVGLIRVGRRQKGRGDHEHGNGERTPVHAEIGSGGFHGLSSFSRDARIPFPAQLRPLNSAFRGKDRVKSSPAAEVHPTASFRPAAGAEPAESGSS
jgi:hypothetical protein